jgi:hypothetical protein
MWVLERNEVGKIIKIHLVCLKNAPLSDDVTAVNRKHSAALNITELAIS